MISLDTLLFPDTDISKDKFYPLFLFCRPMHFLQPIEPDRDAGQNEIDSFIKRGMCQGHTPSPLGNNRERFLHLVKDIKERKDDYAAQLSSLTIASLSTPASQKGGEARHEILSSLLKNHDMADAAGRQAETELWQARLVLAIAEILDREEEELSRQINALDEHELGMFRALRGEEELDGEDPFAELERIRASMEKARPQEAKKRFKSWLKLMQGADLPPELLWLASSRDAADQIITAYEKHADLVIQPVLKLPLPARIMVSISHLIDQIEQFQKSAAEVHQGITADLERLRQTEPFVPGAPENLLPQGTDWVEKWQGLVESHFPASSHGRSYLTLYLLPGARIDEILSFPLAPAADRPAHGLLGIFEN